MKYCASVVQVLLACGPFKTYSCEDFSCDNK